MFAKFFGSRKPRPAAEEGFSLSSLQEQCEKMVSFSVFTALNCEDAVETLRRMTELLIWGDQHDPRFFDLFAEKRMISELLRIQSLSPDCPALVQKQIIQSVSMLLQNTNSNVAVFYVLSNNYVNELISYPFDFSNEDIFATYISFLKAQSLRLNPTTIHFFFSNEGFPLFEEAVRYCNYPDNIVRVFIRTLALNVLKCDDVMLRQQLLESYTAPYFKEQSLAINNQLQLISTSSISQSSDRYDQQADMIQFFEDITDVDIPTLQPILIDQLVTFCVFPCLFGSLYQAYIAKTGDAKLVKQFSHPFGQALPPYLALLGLTVLQKESPSKALCDVIMTSIGSDVLPMMSGLLAAYASHPSIKSQINGDVFMHQLLTASGISESALEEKLDSFLKQTKEDDVDAVLQSSQMHPFAMYLPKLQYKASIKCKRELRQREDFRTRDYLLKLQKQNKLRLELLHCRMDTLRKTLEDTEEEAKQYTYSGSAMSPVGSVVTNTLVGSLETNSSPLENGMKVGSMPVEEKNALLAAKTEAYNTAKKQHKEIDAQRAELSILSETENTLQAAIVEQGSTASAIEKTVYTVEALEEEEGQHRLLHANWSLYAGGNTVETPHGEVCMSSPRIDKSPLYQGFADNVFRRAILDMSHEREVDLNALMALILAVHTNTLVDQKQIVSSGMASAPQLRKELVLLGHRRRSVLFSPALQETEEKVTPLTCFDPMTPLKMQPEYVYAHDIMQSMCIYLLQHRASPTLIHSVSSAMLSLLGPQQSLKPALHPIHLALLHTSLGITAKRVLSLISALDVVETLPTSPVLTNVEDTLFPRVLLLHQLLNYMYLSTIQYKAVIMQQFSMQLAYKPFSQTPTAKSQSFLHYNQNLLKAKDKLQYILKYGSTWTDIELDSVTYDTGDQFPNKYPEDPVNTSNMNLRVGPSSNATEAILLEIDRLVALQFLLACQANPGRFYAQMCGESADHPTAQQQWMTKAVNDKLLERVDSSIPPLLPSVPVYLCVKDINTTMLGGKPKQASELAYPLLFPAAPKLQDQICIPVMTKDNHALAVYSAVYYLLHPTPPPMYKLPKVVVKSLDVSFPTCALTCALLSNGVVHKHSENQGILSNGNQTEPAQPRLSDAGINRRHQADSAGTSVTTQMLMPAYSTFETVSSTMLISPSSCGEFLYILKPLERKIPMSLELCVPVSNVFAYMYDSSLRHHVTGEWRSQSTSWAFRECTAWRDFANTGEVVRHIPKTLPTPLHNLLSHMTNLEPLLLPRNRAPVKEIAQFIRSLRAPHPNAQLLKQYKGEFNGLMLSDILKECSLEQGDTFPSSISSQEILDISTKQTGYVHQHNDFGLQKKGADLPVWVLFVRCNDQNSALTLSLHINTLHFLKKKEMVQNLIDLARLPHSKSEVQDTNVFRNMNDDEVIAKVSELDLYRSAKFYEEQQNGKREAKPYGVFKLDTEEEEDKEEDHPKDVSITDTHNYATISTLEHVLPEIILPLVEEEEVSALVEDLKNVKITHNISDTNTGNDNTDSWDNTNDNTTEEVAMMEEKEEQVEEQVVISEEEVGMSKEKSSTQDELTVVEEEPITSEGAIPTEDVTTNVTNTEVTGTSNNNKNKKKNKKK